MATSKLAEAKAKDSSTYWKKRADQAWAELAHRQEVCAFHELGHCAGRLEAHHLITRAVKSLRHDPMNAIILCTLCHKYSTHHAPHMAPIGFAETLRKLYPDKYEWVMASKWQVGKVNYREAYERLVAILTAH